MRRSHLFTRIGACALVAFAFINLLLTGAPRATALPLTPTAAAPPTPGCGPALRPTAATSPAALRAAAPGATMPSRSWIDLLPGLPPEVLGDAVLGLPFPPRAVVALRPSRQAPCGFAAPLPLPARGTVSGAALAVLPAAAAVVPEIDRPLRPARLAGADRSVPRPPPAV